MPEHRPGPDPEPTDFERRLALMKPSAIALDRDRMLYEAGRAAARAEPRGRALAAIAAGLAVVVVALGGLLARERTGRRMLEVAIEARARETTPIAPAAVPSPRPIEPDSYLALRRDMLAGRFDPEPRKGLDRPPAEPAEAPSPLRVRGRLVDL